MPFTWDASFLVLYIYYINVRVYAPLYLKMDLLLIYRYCVFKYETAFKILMKFVVETNGNKILIGCFDAWCIWVIIKAD